MLKICFILLIVYISFPSCTVTKVNSTSKSEYSSSRYLTATGLGQSEIMARNQAVVEISRIFESKVLSDTFDRISSLIDEKGNEAYRQSIESNIRVKSNVNLKGVKIEKVWFEKNKNTFFALAVLEKEQARDQWLREIDNIDNNIEGEFLNYEEIESKFIKLKTMKKIQKFWIDREVIVSRLRVLGFKKTGVVTYKIKSIFNDIPKIKSNMLIFVKVDGDSGYKIQEKISEILSRRGFVITDVNKNADLQISGNVSLLPVKLNNPEWKFTRASISLTIKDVKMDLTLGEISENRRAGHLNYEEAAHKALEKISSVASDKLIAYFDNSQ